MMNLLSKGLVICFLIVTSCEQPYFSFRSQYDGYIYPAWIYKPVGNLYLYEDAVVVGKDFIVLGDGVGRKIGLSGIYSTYQCLMIAQMLSESKATTKESLFSEVKTTSINVMKRLKFNEVKAPKNDVATTLVYIKIENNQLLAGIIGDSGFAVFRFDSQAGIMKLRFLSKQMVRGFNNPYTINSGELGLEHLYDIETETGDVVIAFSDGVTDVLSIPFILAAMNFLIATMINKVEAGKKPLESLNYEYVLGEFVEAYIQNLHALSMGFLDKILNNIEEINENKKSVKPKQNIVQKQPEQKVDINKNKQSVKPRKNIFHKQPEEDVDLSDEEKTDLKFNNLIANFRMHDKLIKMVNIN